MVANKTKIRILAVAAMLLLTLSGTANAAFYNFGTLDIQPVEKNGTPTNDWLVEYLNPGEKHQEQIRVSNFSPEEKNLKLYVADIDTNDKNSYTVRPLGEQQEDLNDWITLPTKEIVLKSGESKILSVNIQTPKNAGVGLHTGGVMIREIVSDKNKTTQYAIEKGVRIYLNITGLAITQAENTSLTLHQSSGQITAESLVRNTGTTDFHPNFGIELQDFSGAEVAKSNYNGKVKPHEEQSITASINKPDPGFYKIIVHQDGKLAVIGSIAVIPAWAPMLVLAAILAYAIIQKPKTITRTTFTNIIATISNNIQQNWNSLALQRSIAFIGIITISAGSTLYFATINPLRTNAQDTRKIFNSYELTVKWGNFRNFRLPKEYHKTWDGNISVANGNMYIQSLRDFEKTDSAEIINNGTGMDFTVKTGPDNDGVILNIIPIGENIPTITYLDHITGETFQFIITDYLNTAGIYPSGIFSTYISTELGAEHAVSNANLLASGLATSEAEATPEPIANIPELENLFTQDLPATPEVLADFILTSDYVKEISTEKKIAEVKTDKILINALSATPEVLADIAATPDLNFIFVPNETINFPAQDFSFDDLRLSTQEIGTMIFVMNKKTPWNTYVTSTNFQSLSSNATIPATALTVIPGKAEIISTKDSATIQTGNPRSFTSSGDKSTLVNVKASMTQNTAFVLHPILQIRVPAGTLPGHYQAALTISSL